MTDEELFDKLKSEGECWHEFSEERGGYWGREDLATCARSYVDPYCVCSKCGVSEGHRNKNPDFSTWEGFGVLWEGMRKHPRWRWFISKLYYAESSHHMIEDIDYMGHIDVETIHPARFRDALKEFFEKEKK